MRRAGVWRTRKGQDNHALVRKVEIKISGIWKYLYSIKYVSYWSEYLDVDTWFSHKQIDIFALKPIGHGAIHLVETVVHRVRQIIKDSVAQ